MPVGSKLSILLGYHVEAHFVLGPQRNVPVRRVAHALIHSFLQAPCCDCPKNGGCDLCLKSQSQKADSLLQEAAVPQLVHGIIGDVNTWKLVLKRIESLSAGLLKWCNRCPNLTCTNL